MLYSQFYKKKYYFTCKKTNIKQQTCSKNWERSMLRLYIINTYLTYMQSTLREMPSWDETQSGIKISLRNIKSRDTDDTTLMVEREKELKSLLIKVKEESEKHGLGLTIQKTKIMDMVPSLHGK